MTSIFDFVRNKLTKVWQDDKVFMYEGKYLKVLAFFHGINDTNIKEIKKLARKEGMKYNFTYECYMKPQKDNYAAYRKEKNEFLEQFVCWKLKQPKEE